MDINLTNVQSKPIVVSANQTAENDRVYHVVANATFTDPSPIEGRGYKVFVRNGTAVIGGLNFTSGMTIIRTFHSGSWANSSYSRSAVSNSTDESTSNKSTDVNADQASNAKYPSVKALFDWATALFFPKPTGTTSQYLRGDGSLETFPSIPNPANFVEKSDFTSHSILAKQSGGSDPVAVSIGNNEILGRKSGGGSNIEGLSVSEAKAILNYGLSDIGIQYIQDLTPSSVVTGTTTETIVKSIPLWTLTNGSILRVFNLKLTKIAVASVTVRLYINNVDNNLSGAIQIATTGGTWPNTGRYVDVLRTFNIVSGNIEGLSSTAGVITDTVNNTSQHSSQSLPSGQLYLIVTVQNGAVGEETTLRSICLKNL
jgi:hypothetical protein